MENESLVTEPTKELPDEPLSPAPSTEGGEPKEEPKESQPQPDIETRFQELERKFVERDAKLLAELERTTKRLKDSNDSVVKRIHERLKPIQEDYQELIQAGTMTAEDASRRIAEKRLRFEAEELNRAPAVEKQPPDEDESEFDQAVKDILRASGLSFSDPEFEMLPRDPIDRHGRPTRSRVAALEGYRTKVGELVKQKNERISAAKQRKQQEVAEKIPTMTTQGGAAVPESATLDELAAKMKKLQNNLSHDPSERAKQKKEIDELDTRMAKMMSG